MLKTKTRKKAQKSGSPECNGYDRHITDNFEISFENHAIADTNNEGKLSFKMQHQLSFFQLVSCINVFD